MEQVMYDVYIAEATIESDYNNFNTPEKKEAYVRQVFEKNGITQAQWDTSLSWYSERIDLYLQLNDSVKSRLKREQTLVDKEIAQQSYADQELETSMNGIASIPKIYSFNYPGSNRTGFSFNVTSSDLHDDIAEDVFDFNYSVIGVGEDMGNKLKSLISLHYVDTTIYISKNIDVNGAYNEKINKYISEDTLVGIKGYFYLDFKENICSSVKLYNISLGDDDITTEDVAEDDVKVEPMEMR
jgi:hypothetical protein